MIQILFLCLLVVALLAGSMTYFHPTIKPINPLQFVMNESGIDNEYNVNRKKSQQINMTTNGGLLEIHKQMDNLSIAQAKAIDAIKDQQQVLTDANKDAAAILQSAQQAGSNGLDFLRLQELTAATEDEKRLLLTNGQYLVSLNDQLTKSRQELLEQINLADINTQTSLDNLQKQNSALNTQAVDFFDQVDQYNAHIRDQMDNLKGQINGIPDDATLGTGWRSAKEQLNNLMEKSHEDMANLADSEQKARDMADKSKQEMQDSQDRMEDLKQHTQDLIDEQRQKQEEQKERLASP